VGVNVPEQIGIIGVDNDELVCELSAPTLSSVTLNCEQVGFEGAKILDSVLAGKKPDPAEILVEPINVVPRQSTDAVGIDDPVVAAALRFIREHVCEAISVADLSRRAFVSRRALEIRFEKVLGRPPHEEILRCRMARARELLINTDMKLSAISTASGFSSIRYMHRTFQRKLKQTPGEFRIANRPVAR
jgi:LacI family transcriptional regulator